MDNIRVFCARFGKPEGGMNKETIREFGLLMKSEIGRQLNQMLSREDSKKFREVIYEAYTYAVDTVKISHPAPSVPTEDVMDADKIEKCLIDLRTIHIGRYGIHPTYKDIAHFISKFRIHPFSRLITEEEIYTIMANVANDDSGGMTPLGEEITRNQAKAILKLLQGDKNATN